MPFLLVGVSQCMKTACLNMIKYSRPLLNSYSIVNSSMIIVPSVIVIEFIDDVDDLAVNEESHPPERVRTFGSFKTMDSS